MSHSLLPPEPKMLRYFKGTPDPQRPNLPRGLLSTEQNCPLLRCLEKACLSLALPLYRPASIASAA